MDLLENMTDLVKYQTGRKESDPDLVQETGGSLLHGLSNALSISTPRANSNGRKSEEMDKATDNNNRKTDQTEVYNDMTTRYISYKSTCRRLKELASLACTFSHLKPRDVPKGISFCSFLKLCIHMHVHKTTFERKCS